MSEVMLPIGVMLGLTAVCAILATRFFCWERRKNRLCPALSFRPL